MANGIEILIIGGYGTVGRRVAADLAPDYPGRVIVAGRSTERPAQCAAELGHGVRGRRVDVGDSDSVEAALDGVGLVVSCIDQSEPHLLRAAIGRGLTYTDIAPHLMTRRPTEAMRAEAAQSGARIVLGTGLAPGISSLLARMGADRVGAVESVKSNVLLSVGDAYGPASRNYIMGEIALAYAVRIEGREVPMRPFSGSARVDFPPPLGERTAYPFPFSDQVFFPETLGARTAITRLVLDPPWIGTLLSVLVRLRVTAGLRRRGSSQEQVQRLIARLQRRYEGRDWYGVVVDVRGARGRVRASLVGRGQASGTAIGVAAVVRALAESEVEQSGIWLAEQVIPPDPFFERLAAQGLVPRNEVPLSFMHPSTSKDYSPNFALTVFSEVRTRLGPVASYLWWKGSSRPRSHVGLSRDAHAERRTRDGRTHRGGYIHYQNRSDSASPCDHRVRGFDGHPSFQGSTHG